MRGARAARRPRDGFIEVFRLDQVVAAQLLLGVGIGAVLNLGLAVDDLYACRIDGIAAGGDSGGPMFADGRQVGVASTSVRSSVSNYTSLNNSSYRSWIRTNAGV